MIGLIPVEVAILSYEQHQMKRSGPELIHRPPLGSPANRSESGHAGLTNCLKNLGPLSALSSDGGSRRFSPRPHPLLEQTELA